MTQNGKPSVIYIDDEEINLFIFKEMFRNDFEIYTTTSAEEALVYLGDNRVDLVVTDQIMPIMTGVEFLEKLKELIPEGNTHPKKIMVSGYTKEGEVTRALENNLMDKFVKKPWVYEDLKGVLLETII